MRLAPARQPSEDAVPAFGMILGTIVGPSGSVQGVSQGWGTCLVLPLHPHPALHCSSWGLCQELLCV